MPFEKLAFSLDPESTLAFQGVARVRYMQWVMNVIAIWTGAIAIVGIVAALAIRQLPPLLAIAATSALAAHGCLLLTAILAIGLLAIHAGRLARDRHGDRLRALVGAARRALTAR